MSNQINTEYAIKFADTIELLLQQKESRFRSCVMMKTVTGAKQGVPVEQIGPVTANIRTTRYPPLTPDDTPHDRPWVFPIDYDWADFQDSIDKLRILVDPTSSYAMNARNAMNRAMDDQVIKAFFADRKTGEAAATTVSFPAGQQVSVSLGAASATGLNVKKLREARRLLLAAEVDLEEDMIYVAASAKQLDDLLDQIQVISTDFNNESEKPVLKDGRITRFLGMNFVHSERLPTDASGYRRNPVWARSGMYLGMWQDIAVDISQRRDLRGLPTQVYVYGTFGATRSEEKKVVEIKCSES